uniref:Uncharacterized protein n=1 Tax=Ditylenchus dipsaci TaxID=166011 RepID=A0A915CZK0_9BILA
MVDSILCNQLKKIKSRAPKCLGNLNGGQHPLKLIEEDQQSVSDLQGGHSEIESNYGSQLSKSRKRKAYTTKTKLDAVEYSKAQQDFGKLQIQRQPVEDSRGSIGWLGKFMERHNFRARMQTTVCQKPPLEYEQALVNFCMHVSQLREKTKYSTCLPATKLRYGWPEWWKMYCEKGAKEVSVLTTGHDAVMR